MAQEVSKDTFALIAEVRALKSSVEKGFRPNFKIHFVNGIVYGLGTAFGATVIFAIAVFVYNYLASLGIVQSITSVFPR